MFSITSFNSILEIPNTRDTPKSLKCNACEKCFSHESTFLNHCMKCHEGEKTFDCDVCQKSFVMETNLKEHMETHTGEKPYNCRVCHKRFAVDGQLKKHMKFHAGEKPFHCDICQKSCLLKTHREQHLRNHGQEILNCEEEGKLDEADDISEFEKVEVDRREVIECDGQIDFEETDYVLLEVEELDEVKVVGKCDKLEVNKEPIDCEEEQRKFDETDLYIKKEVEEFDDVEDIGECEKVELKEEVCEVIEIKEEVIDCEEMRNFEGTAISEFVEDVKEEIINGENEENYYISESKVFKEEIFGQENEGKFDEGDASKSRKRGFLKVEILMNTVRYLQSINFYELTLDEQILIKERGRHTPVLYIQQSSTCGSKRYTCQFNTSVYQKCEWLCGCNEKNALFCFPCLVFGGVSSWTKSGMTDLKRLPEKIKKHEQSVGHMNNMIDLSMLSKVNIAAQANSTYKLSAVRHNEMVRKNRYVLSKIIDCVKIFGKFELPMEHDRTMTTRNSEVFQGLLEFFSGPNSSFDSHIHSSTTVFEGISESIQNELLDSMLVICRNNIRKEVRNVEYLSVMCDETTDSLDRTQMVIVLRYELQGKPVERFWGFFNTLNRTTEALSILLLKELQILIGDCPRKLIAQTYDGAGAFCSISKCVKNVYRNAHFIHCYAHKVHLIFEKATSQHSNARIFFNSLSGIPAYFSKFPQRMTELQNIAVHRIPIPSTTVWNFKGIVVNAVQEIKEDIIECCTILEGSNSKDTGYGAASIKRIVSDPEFEFWLEFFSKIMHHGDIMSSQFQSRNIDAAKANTSLKSFISTVQKLRDECDAFALPPEEMTLTIAAKDVSNIILLECRERFSFTNHLEASKLLYVNNFTEYTKDFPNDALLQAVAAYPMLEKDKLKTELTVLYTREDLYKSGNLIDLLEIMNNNNLQLTFSEIAKLMKILITTPMTTPEEERCFSTLKRINTFLCNNMSNNRLSALAMLSIENGMIMEMEDFNEQVTNHFATSKSTDFVFMEY